MKAASPFRKLSDPVALMHLRGIEPPSPVIATILRGLYDPERLGEDEVGTWRRLTGQGGLTGLVRRVFQPAPSKARGAVWTCCIGRRGLKTTGIAAWVLVFETLCGGHEDHALPGSEVYFACVAPTLRQASIAVRAVRVVLDSLAPLGVAYEIRGEGERTEITLKRPTSIVSKVITVMVAKPEHVRGFAFPVVVFDEAGHFKSDTDHVATDREILQAIRPSQLTFPNARLLLVGTPGATGTLFQDMVEKPPAASVLVRAASWETNHRVTEEQCREFAALEAVGDVSRYFDQEYRAARFGAVGEAFLAEEDVRACVDPKRCDDRPYGERVIGLDVGLVHDATAIVRARVFYVQPSTGSLPIVHVVLEAVESHRGDRTAPLSLPGILDRVGYLARGKFVLGRVPVVADAHMGPEVQRQLRERGIHAELVPMSPTAQEKRWRTLAQLIQARRLHIPDHRELISQLSKLKVTQLSSGAFRVEGRRDDIADAVALAVEHAVERLTPCNEHGANVIDWEFRPVRWDPETGVSGGGRRWFRRLPNGTRLTVEPPVGTPEWDEHVAQAQAEGLSSPAIEEARSRGLLSVRVDHD